MKDVSIELLNIIYDYGYEAYIVGGFVRDMLLNIPSKDIDITTNATPMELKNIFPSIDIPTTSYGSVTLYYKNCRFEITTYREETGYHDNRHPSVIKYVNDLEKDLLRRDFTINTICLDKDDNIVDLLNGQKDLKEKVIKTIGSSDKSFTDDALRILRAIRFATILDFQLSQEIIDAINKNKSLLLNLSYERKMSELDKIFASTRAKEGMELIKTFQLEEYLELPNLERVKDYSDLMGIWAMINPSKYHFNNNQQELIKKINEVYEMDNLNNLVLYYQGLYVNVLAGVNKGLNKKTILEKYENLPIKVRSDINITAKEICEILNKKPGSFISEIYNDLEKSILKGEILNIKENLERYIINKY